MCGQAPCWGTPATSLRLVAQPKLSQAAALPVRSAFVAWRGREAIIPFHLVRTLPLVPLGRPQARLVRDAEKRDPGQAEGARGDDVRGNMPFRRFEGVCASRKVMADGALQRASRTGRLEVGPLLGREDGRHGCEGLCRWCEGHVGGATESRREQVYGRGESDQGENDAASRVHVGLLLVREWLRTPLVEARGCASQSTDKALLRGRL